MTEYYSALLLQVTSIKNRLVASGSAENCIATLVREDVAAAYERDLICLLCALTVQSLRILVLSYNPMQ